MNFTLLAYFSKFAVRKQIFMFKVKYSIFNVKLISGMNSIVLYLGHYVAWNTGPFNYISGNEAYSLGHILYRPSKVEKILKGSLDSIPSPLPSVKIQIMGGKVGLKCKGKKLLGIVNKL